MSPASSHRGSSVRSDKERTTMYPVLSLVPLQGPSPPRVSTVTWCAGRESSRRCKGRYEGKGLAAP